MGTKTLYYKYLYSNIIKRRKGTFHHKFTTTVLLFQYIFKLALSLTTSK